RLVAPEGEADAQGEEFGHRWREGVGAAPIHGDDLCTFPREEAGRGHARSREAQDQRAKAHGYLTLRLTRVISASRMETIQKRTMIFGSGQPLSSKWWWMGAMRKMRLPRILNEATWSITETISTRKTPWRTAEASSCFVITASVPRAPPRASAPMSPMKTLAG